jgi:DNA-binding MarR family transcriptional regulator
MTATPSIDPAELRAWRDSTLYRLLFRASRAESTETVARIQARGHPTMTLGYANLLSNLDVDGTTISSLARRAGVTRQAASQQLVDIERDGYVVREPDPADGRAVLVRQTPRGRGLLATALEVVKGLEAEYAEAVGVEQLATLKRTLAALLTYIDPGGTLGRD